MQQIIYFFGKNRNFFVFILLLGLGLGLIIRSNYYHRSQFLSSANVLSGKLYEIFGNWTEYFSLKSQNELLVKENQLLRSQLLNATPSAENQDSLQFKENHFLVTPARIVKNSIGLSKNYLTINVGEKQGINQDMAVISTNGVVGIVDKSSNNYSVVQSILNTLSQLNAKLKKSRHFGSLRWDGKNLNIVQLIDIPKIAHLAVGDTIVTGGMSSIFPSDIPIGTVQDFSINKYDNSYNINIKLFTDMSNLEHVYILNNLQRKEILELQDQSNE